jgi:hypothetical protein
MSTRPSSPVAEAPVLAANTLPTTASLPQAVATAAAAGQPLVVMTTLRGCPYCDLIRGSYLGPMLRNGQVHAIQLDIRDRNAILQGFAGRTTPMAQAKAWKATFAPTVLFLGPRGEELAERLVGVAVPDLYGGFLDARLSEARQRLVSLKS